MFGRVRVLECVGEGEPVELLLGDAVDQVRLWDPDDVQDGGPMSVAWVNWDRRVPTSLIRSGQETTSGLRVPPRWEPTCLPHWNGVFPAHAQAVA